MQLLAPESILPLSAAQECATLLMEVAPPVVGRIRGEMRRHSMPCLSIAQFRTLIYLRRHPGAPLSKVAEFVGASLPSTSKLVDKLVASKAVKRHIPHHDRRRVSLALTESGHTALELARLETQKQLAESLQALSPQELAALKETLRLLSVIFSPGKAHAYTR